MFGDQCFLIEVVRPKHSENPAKIIEFFAIHRYKLIHGK